MKVVRGDVSLAKERASIEEEVTDLFIYVLKICNQMDIDLESSFLAKLDRNWHRFHSYER